jgi:hypothetical protein
MRASTAPLVAFTAPFESTAGSLPATRRRRRRQAAERRLAERNRHNHGASDAKPSSSVLNLYWPAASTTASSRSRRASPRRAAHGDVAERQLADRLHAVGVRVDPEEVADVRADQRRVLEAKVERAIARAPRPVTTAIVLTLRMASCRRCRRRPSRACR